MGLRRQVRLAIAGHGSALSLDRIADRQQPEQHRGQRSIDAAINQLRARRVAASVRGEQDNVERALRSYARSQARQRELAREERAS